MKIAFTLFLSIFLAVGTAQAQQGRPAAPRSQMTAINTLWAFGKERGTNQLSRVVGMVGFYGQDQPAQWRLLAHDSRQRGVMHEFIVEHGRVVSERRFRREADQDLPSIVIPVSKLAVDSKQAFLLADSAARKDSIGFDSVHYQLRCRDLRNEPVWVLNLSDQARKTVGVLYISAINGELIRKVWHRPGTEGYDSQGKREDVGDYLQKGAGFLTDAFNNLKSKATGQTANARKQQARPQQPQARQQPQNAVPGR